MFEKIGDFLLSYTAKQLLKKAKEDWEVFGTPKQEEIKKAIEILKKDIKVYEKLENEESQTIYRFETLESYFLLTTFYEKLSLFDDDILDETEVSQKSAIQEVEARLDLLQEPKQMAKVYEYLARYYSSIDIEKTQQYNTLALENIQFVKTNQQKALIYHRQAMSYYQNSDRTNAKKYNALALKYDNSLKMAKILDVKLALDEPSFDIQTIQTKLNNLKIQLQTDKNLLADVHIIEANMYIKLGKDQDGIKAYDEAYNSIKAKDGLEVKKSFILYALSMLKDNEGIGTQAIILDNQSKNYRYDMKYYIEIARLMNKKGFELYHKGKYDKALEYYQKILNIRLKIYGENNPDTATNYQNMGSICYNRLLAKLANLPSENHYQN
jgi:tetratricopeptide (TPR) repeat protein